MAISNTLSRGDRGARPRVRPVRGRVGRDGGLRRRPGRGARGPRAWRRWTRPRSRPACGPTRAREHHGHLRGPRRHRHLRPQRHRRDPSGHGRRRPPGAPHGRTASPRSAASATRWTRGGSTSRSAGLAEGPDGATGPGLRVGRPAGPGRPRLGGPAHRATGTGRPARQDGPHYLRYCGTPPITHLYGLREALAMIDDEGLEAVWARHARAGQLSSEPRSRPGPRPGGLELNIADPAARSNAVTTILGGTVDTDRLRAVCQEQAGLTLGVGLGAHEGRAFRIGHMGHLNPPMVLGTLGTIEAALGSPPATPTRVAAARRSSRRPWPARIFAGLSLRHRLAARADLRDCAMPDLPHRQRHRHRSRLLQAYRAAAGHLRGPRRTVRASERRGDHRGRAGGLRVVVLEFPTGPRSRPGTTRRPTRRSSTCGCRAPASWCWSRDAAEVGDSCWRSSAGPARRCCSGRTPWSPPIAWPAAASPSSS